MLGEHKQGGDRICLEMRENSFGRQQLKKLQMRAENEEQSKRKDLESRSSEVGKCRVC